MIISERSNYGSCSKNDRDYKYVKEIYNKNNWDRYMERSQEFIIKNYSNVLELPIAVEEE